MSALGSLELQCDTQASHIYTHIQAPDGPRVRLLLSIVEAGGATNAGTQTPTDIFLFSFFFYRALPLPSTYYVEHQFSELATRERTTKMFSNLGTADTKTTLF